MASAIFSGHKVPEHQSVISLKISSIISITSLNSCVVFMPAILQTPDSRARLKQVHNGPSSIGHRQRLIYFSAHRSAVPYPVITSPTVRHQRCVGRHLKFCSMAPQPYKICTLWAHRCRFSKLNESPRNRNVRSLLRTKNSASEPLA